MVSNNQETENIMKTERRKFMFSMLAAGAALGGSALAGALFPRKAAAAATGRNRTVILYYSWSGNTKTIAAQIHRNVGGDLIELELVRPYSSTYNTCVEEAKRDQANQARPELKTRIADFKQYDTVFMGYPNWWGSFPMPIATLLESYEFSGKTILPFCSHGGGGLGRSVADIARLAPRAAIKEALAVHYGGGDSLSRDIDAWLRKNGVDA